MNIILFLKKLSTFYIILLGLFLLIFTSAIFTFFLYLFNEQVVNKEVRDKILSSESGVYYQFFMNVFFAPFIETLFFQKWIIQFVRFFYKDGKYFKISSILLSSVCFGLMHFYSLLYMLKTFLLGIVLAFFYVEFNHKKLNSFWIVFAMHAIFNLIVTIVSLYNL
jgi:membrane protease YdiL (CAAX protease family)